MSTWLLALVIFGLRIVDVSLGTMRTITVVQGHRRWSVVLGFFEVLIWITAVSQVIVQVKTTPLLAVAFAGGFAAGNAVGITLERRLALGAVIVRIISADSTRPITEQIRELGQRVTTFEGCGSDSPETLIYVTCLRRHLRQLLELVRDLDPQAVYAVEPIREWSLGIPTPLPSATGWRAPYVRK